MDIKFMNAYTRNKEWAEESMRYAYFHMPVYVVCMMIVGLYFPFGILQFAGGNTYGIAMIVMSVLGLGAFWLIYQKNVKLQLNRDIEMYGSLVDVIVTVTEEYIQQKLAPSVEYRLHYHDIRWVGESKKYIFINSKSNMFYSLKKDSFSIGTHEEFIAFLKRKGAKIR